MKYKTLCGDVKIPVLGLGTWKIGGGREADYSQDKESIEAIRAAIKMGYTHIDTAEMYGVGHCEELVGEAIKDFDRGDLFITTKVTKTNLRYDDVIAAAERSLERLQIDYIDLYLIHAPNPEIPIKETMKAMDDLVNQGKVRFIGVSNFSLEDLKEAQKCARNNIVNNQIEYSLLTRNKGKYGHNKSMESDVVPYCQSEGIIVTTERPIERGLLLKPHPVLDKLASKYSKTKAQIAINWLISKKGIITIPKSTDLGHLKENLGALEWRLSDEDMKLLDDTDFESLREEGI